MTNKIIPGEREKTLVQLDANIDLIKEDMVVILDKFFDIGKTLAYIQEHKLFKLKNYKNFIEFCKKEFSLSKNQAYNIVGIYNRFNKPEFKSFNYSQLTEMLSLSDEQINKVDSKMSSKKIRDLKKVDSSRDEIVFGEQTSVIDVDPDLVVEHKEKEKEIGKMTVKESAKFWEERCFKQTEAYIKEMNDIKEKYKQLENDNANLLSQIVDMHKLQKENDKLKKENEKLRKSNDKLKKLSLQKTDELIETIVKKDAEVTE